MRKFFHHPSRGHQKKNSGHFGGNYIFKPSSELEQKKFVEEKLNLRRIKSSSRDSVGWATIGRNGDLPNGTESSEKDERCLVIAHRKYFWLVSKWDRLLPGSVWPASRLESFFWLIVPNTYSYLQLPAPEGSFNSTMSFTSMSKPLAATKGVH